VLAGPITTVVLATDPALMTALEKEADLAARLAANTPFTAAGRQIHVLGSSAYAGGRMLYQCVELTPGA
jgi:hypothetical protein